MKSKINITQIIIVLYVVFVVFSFIAEFDAGIDVFNNFLSFSIKMFQILPCAFILIGLIEVWISREMIEKFFGEASGLMGHIWAIILSSTTVGGAYVAFPLGYTLLQKGAKLSIVLTYIGSAALTRIPMTIFEASFLGIKFTLTRLLVSIPLVILSSIILGKTANLNDIPKNIND